MFSTFFIFLIFQTIKFSVSQGPDGFDFKNPKSCNPFRCPDGQEPVPKKPLKLSSKGCSGMGGKSMSFAKPREGDELLEGCCDQRNACLQICGASKVTCENEYKTCTSSICNSIEDEEQKKSCESSSNMHSLMASISGCMEFDETQNQVCQCVAADKANERREQTLTDFYKKYNRESVDKVPGLVSKAENPRKFATLLSKLVKKFPESIKKIKDPTQKMMEEMMRNGKLNEENIDAASSASRNRKKTANAVVDDPDSENVDLDGTAEL